MACEDLPSEPLAATVTGDFALAAFGSLLEQPGDFIGPFRLLQKIGSGGFGDVWRAEQLKPIHREVALKVIKPGMDSEEVIARFNLERQALAMMDHPNIAAVFDAGTTANGRPYFVMELVKGTPLTAYCDERKLTVRQRLEIFIPVCQAVQHAHQKAILHRDLKPSNILVEEVDGKPVPKVIDFGIAKALGTSPETALRSSLAQTVEGMLVGTPQYMSPEQAGSVPDVDTRSDVYTLGIVLYELLTGQPPLTREVLRKAGINEVLRLIRESEAARPSSRMMPVNEAVKLHATERHADPQKLSQSLRGDLDWIALKALSKEREHRYQTVNALALDLRRHLDDEPVSAGPPSASYRLKKFIRRKKGLVIASLAVLLCLVAGIIGTSIALVREQKALDREMVQRERAEDEEKRATEEADNSRRVADFLRSTLSQAAAEVSSGKDAEALLAALRIQVPKLEEAFRDQPEVLYRVTTQVATIYHQFDMHKEALPLSRKAGDLARQVYGNDHEETLSRLSWVAIEERQHGDKDEAIQLFKEIIARRRAHGQVLEVNSKILRDMQNLIYALIMQNQQEEAHALRQEIATLYGVHEELGKLSDPLHLHDYAEVLRDLGDPKKALQILQKITEPGVPGLNDWDLNKCLIERMQIERELGCEPQALLSCQRGIVLVKRAPEKWQKARSLLTHAKFLMEGAHWSAAEDLMTDVLEIAHSSGHHNTIASAHDLARDLFRRQNKLPDCEAHARAAWESTKKYDSSWPSIIQHWRLVDALARNRKFNEAIQCANDLWQIAKKTSMGDQSITARHQVADDVARLFRDMHVQTGSADLAEQVRLWRARAFEVVTWDQETTAAEFHKMLGTIMWRMATFAQDGDLKGIQQIRARFLGRSQDAHDERFARYGALILLTVPADKDVLQRATEFADFAHKALPEQDESRPWALVARNLSLYRNGRFAEAKSALQVHLKGKNTTQSLLSTTILAAMVEHQLGHRDAALLMLRQVEQSAELGSRNYPYDNYTAFTRVLFNEARTAINP